MKRVPLFLTSWVISIAILSCNSNNKDKASDTKSGDVAFDMQKARAFIDSINTKFTEELKNGDSMAIASHYGPDAEILLSNSEPIKGNNILSAWGSTIRNGMTDWKFTTTDLEGNADFLIETGSYEINDKTKKLMDKGTYVVIWKKQQNGEWKLYRDVGVTTMPAMAAK